MIRASFIATVSVVGAALGGERLARRHARPDLQSAVDVLAAGGGPAEFKTTTLVEALAGASAADDLAELTRRGGVTELKRSIAVLDYIVAGARRRLAARGRLPAPTPVDAIDGRALAMNLYAAGIQHAAAFDADRMVDRLISRQLRIEIMRDVDATFGRRAGDAYKRTVRFELQRIAADRAP